jgi:hypothetical protein
VSAEQQEASMSLSFIYATSTIEGSGASLAVFPGVQTQIQQRIVSSKSLSFFSDDTHGAIAKAAAQGIDNNAMIDPMMTNFVLMIWEQWLADKKTHTLLPVYFLGYKGHLYSLSFGYGDKPKKLKKLGKLQPAMLKATVIPKPMNGPANALGSANAPSPSAVQPGQANSDVIYVNGTSVRTSDIIEEFYM